MRYRESLEMLFCLARRRGMDNISSVILPKTEEKK